jgi:hypothetical protein
MNLPAKDDRTARACNVNLRKHCEWKMWFGRAPQTHKTRFSMGFRNNPILEATLHTWRRSTNMYRSMKCQNTATASQGVYKSLLDFYTLQETCEIIYERTVRTP